MPTEPTSTARSPLEALREAPMLREVVRDLLHVALSHEPELLERVWPRADAASEVENVLRQVAARGILIPQPDEVRGYLLRYPDIIDVVRCAAMDAWERLAHTAQLSLELYRDPEIEDRYLTIYVRQQDYDDGLLEALDEISAAHEAALATTSGWLLITTDFEDPV